MANANVTLTITGMPGLMADMRAEFARLVRAVAEDEVPEVAARLREIAAAFEAGQGVEP